MKENEGEKNSEEWLRCWKEEVKEGREGVKKKHQKGKNNKKLRRKTKEG